MHSLPLLTRAARRAVPVSQSLPFAYTFRGLASKPPHETTPKNPSYSPDSQSQREPSQPTSPPSSQTAEKPESTTAPETAPLSPASLSLDFAPPDASTERTGARSSKDSLSSIERKRRVMARFGVGMFAVTLVAGGIWLGRDWEEGELKERRLTPENAPSTRWGRTTQRFTSMFDYFSKPAWSELLPPPLPPPHQRPYTLLISLDDLLVTSTWDRQHGWRTAKRPGVDYFIAYLSQFYEIVIFTTQYYYTAYPVIDKLDPYMFFVSYRLTREATRSTDSGPVKDLSYLNRPLDRVILLDAHPEHTSAHPENAIIMKPWKGEARDRGLIEMIPFLESIGIFKPPDVRPVLKAYEGKDIPKEYAKREAEGKKQFLENVKARGGVGMGGGALTLSSLFSSGAKASSVPETYLEAKRREAQAWYLEEQKFLSEHKDEFEQQKKENEEAAMREMSGSLWTTVGTLMGVPPGVPAPGQNAPEARSRA
ncbi:hypothetical protein EW146_g886 [Bondarzewia mesenterica]|uniref:Mitochondrial import inner membrane translocase subunit TIM50 n=1 Tax=Bondarzewia mesenterica TaxID=1095465 RepID=A0A4S4M5L1_9AGAM|nr:hypothetical protein EW146_g886 [Bondarzewia mesenterica]